jgi:hypothetical protein
MLRNFAARMFTNENNLLAGVLFITLTSFAFAHEAPPAWSRSAWT